MPKATEFVIRMEDQPGMLGKCCKVLGEHGVNIMAFDTFIHEGKSGVRLVVDNAAHAKAAFDAQHMDYKETEVAQVKLPNKPGELGQAAMQLGEANININYAYCGMDPKTNSPLVIFGVKEVAKASTILEKVAKKAA